MVALVARHRGDDAGAGEMLGGPADLLVGGPVAARQAGEDDGVEMANRLEQFHRIVHQRQREVEVGRLSELLPEAAEPVTLFESARRQAEHGGRALVEVGQDAVAVEVELPHGQSAGISVSGIGSDSGCQGPLASTSLLSFAWRPGPSDQVMW